MAEIPLEIKERENDKFLARTLQLNPGNSRSRASADFVVDTGSPRSLISPWFASYLKLPTSRMDFDEPIYMAGVKAKTAKLTGVEIKMQTSSGGIYEDKVDIQVAKVENDAANRMQNILGLDILKDLGLKLVYDCTSGEQAHLEI